MTSTERKAFEWVFGTDTGSSSMTLCQFLLLGKVSGRYIATPSDSGDFGRCFRLLEYVPGFRARLKEARKLKHGWEKLIPKWASLEKLFIKGKNQQLTRQLQTLLYSKPTSTEGSDK